MLGLLAGYCTAGPLLRLMMGFSIFNLDGQTGFAPFEASFYIVLIMLHIIFLITWHFQILAWWFRGVIIVVRVQDRILGRGLYPRDK